MSDELRSARRHRAPTPSGARGRCEAPKVALPPRISPSGADCMVHAGAHRRHAPCGRAARAGVRTTPGRRRTDTPAQSRLRRLLAEATWKSHVGTAFGSNVRTSGHRLFLRRHLSIRRRHRGTERDTARGGRAQILRIRATPSRPVTCLGIGRREGRQRGQEEPILMPLRAHRDSRGPPESAPADLKAPVRPDSLPRGA